MTLTAIVAIVTGLALAGPLPASIDRQPGESFSGRVTTESGRHWFTEVHVVTADGEHRRVRTRYEAPDGRLLAELSADFGQGTYLPDTTFVDYRDRYRYTIAVHAEDGTVTLTQQDGQDARVDTKVLALDDRLMTFIGAQAYVADNLRALADDARLTIDFIVPSRMRSYGVRILKRELTGTRLTLRMEMDSWLLRRFVSPMDMTFDLETGRLLEYAGTAGLLDDDDRAVTVRIAYTYH